MTLEGKVIWQAKVNRIKCKVNEVISASNLKAHTGTRAYRKAAEVQRLFIMQ